MSKVLTEEINYENIADAIRAKNGESTLYKPSEMAAAIAAIPTGGSAVIESKSITANGTYNAPSGVDGYNPVTVNVPNSYTASDEGRVVQSGALVAQTAQTVTANGTYDTTTNNSVVVNVSGGGGPEVPAAYQQVEYISLDKTQWAMHRGPQIVSGQYIWIQYSVNQTAECALVAIAANQITPGGAVPSSEEFECYISNYVTNNSGKVKSYAGSKTNITSGKENIVFLSSWIAESNLNRYFYFSAYRLNPSGNDYPFNGKYYRVYVSSDKLGKNRTHDFVPCYRKSDNGPGLYDVINNEFYPSESGSPFVAGPDV